MQDLIARVEPMIPALRRYARALLRDRDLADDLVQDCLERVIERWDRRRDAGHTRQWVFAIAHNLAVDFLRQRARRGLHLAIEDVAEDEMVAPSQEGEALQRDVLRALDALPDEQRSVLLLVSVEDLSYADAAKTLGIPIGTVMSRLARGRERLQRLMGSPVARREPAAARPALRRLK